MEGSRDSPEAASALLEPLRHNTWATIELIDFLASRDPHILAASAPGTYGAISATIGHIVGAEQFYFGLLTGDRVGRQVRKDEAPRELADLRQLAESLGRRTLELAGTGLDGGRRIAMPSGGVSTAGVILAQLVHHANEHRGQVATILSVSGIEPPPLTGWAYGRACGVSDEDE